jgi:hypothetical protein
MTFDCRTGDFSLEFADHCRKIESFAEKQSVARNGEREKQQINACDTLVNHASYWSLEISMHMFSYGKVERVRAL